MTSGSPQLIGYYDGECGVCARLAQLVGRLDRRGTARMLAATPESIGESPVALDLERCMEELHVVSGDGRVYRGWQAVARLARQFPVTWVVGALGAIPPISWVCSALYRLFARNRHRLGRASCGRGSASGR